MFGTKSLLNYYIENTFFDREKKELFFRKDLIYLGSLIKESKLLYEDRIKVLYKTAFAVTREFSAGLYQNYVAHLDRLGKKIEAYLKLKNLSLNEIDSVYADLTKRLERFKLVLEKDVRNTEAGAEIIPVPFHKKTNSNGKALLNWLNEILDSSNYKSQLGKNDKRWGSDGDIAFSNYSYLRLCSFKGAKEKHIKILKQDFDSFNHKLKQTKLGKISSQTYPRNAFINTFEAFKKYKKGKDKVQEIGSKAIEATNLLAPLVGNDKEVEELIKSKTQVNKTKLKN